MRTAKDRQKTRERNAGAAGGGVRNQDGSTTRSGPIQTSAITKALVELGGKGTVREIARQAGLSVEITAEQLAHARYQQKVGKSVDGQVPKWELIRQ